MVMESALKAWHLSAGTTVETELTLQYCHFCEPRQVTHSSPTRQYGCKGSALKRGWEASMSKNTGNLGFAPPHHLLDIDVPHFISL